jgi:ribosomal protein S17E
MSKKIRISRKIKTKKDAEKLIKKYPDIFTSKVVDRIIKQNKEKK